MQNLTELRESLLDNYIKIKAGKMGLNTAKELSNVAGKVLKATQIELAENIFLGNKVPISFLKTSSEIIKK